MKDSKLDKDIDRLRRTVQKTIGWGEVNEWHSSMFSELSEEVYQKTAVVLSVATLKRFFGVVNHDGSPSTSTLDALSQFVGKANWRVFRTESSLKRIRFKNPPKSVYITIGFILAIVTVSLIGNKRANMIVNASDFAFSTKVLSKEYPNSVVFDLKIPSGITYDDLKIQQYWDPTKTISITSDQHQATGIYYFPGYFRAKLVVDGEEVKSHDLFLKSEGWLGMIEYEPTPKYFQPANREKALSFPASIVQEVTEREEPVKSSFHFVEDFGNISGDNFSFTTVIQNTFDDRWAVCQSLQLFFLGSTGAMIIPFSKIGCTSDNNLMLNDVYLSGKENDLSSLSTDFTQPSTLDIRVKDKEVSVYIDNALVYSNRYQASMGKLVGVRFRFKGLGEVKSYELRNGDEKIPF